MPDGMPYGGFINVYAIHGSPGGNIKQKGIEPIPTSHVQNFTVGKHDLFRIDASLNPVWIQMIPPSVQVNTVIKPFRRSFAPLQPHEIEVVDRQVSSAQISERSVERDSGQLRKGSAELRQSFTSVLLSD